MTRVEAAVLIDNLLDGKPAAHNRVIAALTAPPPKVNVRRVMSFDDTQTLTWDDVVRFLHAAGVETEE